MKKKVTFIAAIFFISIHLMPHKRIYSQNESDIFNRSVSNIVWLGVDFTKTKYNGSLGTVDSYEIIPLFAKINFLIVTERDKFDVVKALRKPSIPFDINMVNSINANVDAEQFVKDADTYHKPQIDVEQLGELVKRYQSDQPYEIGLVFFMETLDKITGTGTMWVTFFRFSDHKILIAERMTGKAGGFGFRNHWANTVYEVLKQIKSSEYNTWKKRYSN
jgi:hypothetical protein